MVVEDGGTVKKSRAGKVVLLGPIGLLARSTQGTVALTVHGKDSAHVFYEVIKMNAAEVRGKLSKALTDAGIAVLAEEPTQAHAASVPDELAKLAALREQGILTDAEFAGQKNKLLAS